MKTIFNIRKKHPDGGFCVVYERDASRHHHYSDVSETRQGREWSEHHLRREGRRLLYRVNVFCPK